MRTEHYFLSFCVFKILPTFPCEAVSLTVLFEASIVFNLRLLIGSKNSFSEEPSTNRSWIHASLASLPAFAARSTSNSTSEEAGAPEAKL